MSYSLICSQYFDSIEKIDDFEIEKLKIVYNALFKMFMENNTSLSIFIQFQ